MAAAEFMLTYLLLNYFSEVHIMQIANPIYDVVFKYLMEDLEIATLIISTIMGEEIELLQFLPQESTVFLPQRSLTVYRLDFSAKIKQPDGTTKQVLIEIQKAKFATDIMRFRRYLGEQYQDKANTYLRLVNEKAVRQALPIVTIYFLGYPLAHIKAPVIKVARRYYDLTTGEELKTSEEFIESLTHDSYVIQIPYLHPNTQSEVEKLLLIFDQHQVTGNDHILDIQEADYPDKYWRIIRRLQGVMADKEMRRNMHAEDEILEELAMLEREIERKNQLVIEQHQTLVEQGYALTQKDQALAQKDETLIEQQQALAQKDETLVQKEQALAQKDETLAQKDETLAEQQRLLAEQQKMIAELQSRLAQ